MNIDLEDLLKMDEAPENKISIADIKKVIKDYISFLWGKKLYVVAACIVGCIVGIVYAYIYKPTYTATYKFSIESKSGGGGGLSALSMLAGINSSSGTFSGDNLVELFRSRSMVEMALLKPIILDGDTMNLLEYKILADSLRLKCDEKNAKEEDTTKFHLPSICDVTFPYGQDRESFSREQDSILMGITAEMMEKNIEIEKIDKKLSYANFSVSSKNEVFAKEFSSAMINTVFDFYLKSKRENTQRNIDEFQSRADSIRKELNKSLYAAAHYRDLNMNPSKSVLGVEQLKYQTDIQINTSAYSEIVKNIEVMKLDMAKSEPLIQEIDVPRYPLANDKKGKLKTGIKYGFVLGFLTVIILCGIHFVQGLCKEETDNETVE
ncbi:MAG: Wzz/FepE/Etk N-terminal domain-containing protein [Paludibacteraceae bacterium]|nr:Wzz/FepE/Etk N-terminal domain-containing protein [Paludibacteraceae bacterium]